MPWVVIVIITTSYGGMGGGQGVNHQKKIDLWVVEVKVERGSQFGIMYLEELCFFMYFV